MSVFSKKVLELNKYLKRIYNKPQWQPKCYQTTNDLRDMYHETVNKRILKKMGKWTEYKSNRRIAYNERERDVKNF